MNSGSGAGANPRRLPAPGAAKCSLADQRPPIPPRQRIDPDATPYSPTQAAPRSSPKSRQHPQTAPQPISAAPPMNLAFQRPVVGAGRPSSRAQRPLPAFGALRPGHSSGGSASPRQQQHLARVSSPTAPAQSVDVQTVQASDVANASTASANDRVRVTFRWPGALGGKEVYIAGAAAPGARAACAAARARARKLALSSCNPPWLPPPGRSGARRARRRAPHRDQMPPPPGRPAQARSTSGMARSRCSSRSAPATLFARCRCRAADTT
jgi:hypothetical protein